MKRGYYPPPEYASTIEFNFTSTEVPYRIKEHGKLFTVQEWYLEEVRYFLKKNGFTKKWRDVAQFDSMFAANKYINEVLDNPPKYHYQ